MSSIVKSSDEMAQLRTLLAAEKTYAAWIRTGLACIGGGLAVIKLFLFKIPLHQTVAHITGQVLIIVGGLTFIFAAWNYRRTYAAMNIEKGKMPSLGLTSILITLGLLIISVLVLWLTV